MYTDYLVFDGICLGIWATDTGVARVYRCGGVPADPNAVTQACKEQLLEYFAGKRKTFDFSMDPPGTAFQEAVWQALLTIPWGETRTYGEIASMIGKPKASRAVGGAIGRNPILIAVPCHRVIGKDGSMTGFSAGLDLKEKLLRLEKVL